jgi:hypothetical protein
VEELLGRHHPVLPEDDPVFRDEPDRAQGVDVGLRIARRGDQVRVEGLPLTLDSRRATVDFG